MVRTVGRTHLGIEVGVDLESDANGHSTDYGNASHSCGGHGQFRLACLVEDRADDQCTQACDDERIEEAVEKAYLSPDHEQEREYAHATDEGHRQLRWVIDHVLDVQVDLLGGREMFLRAFAAVIFTSTRDEHE